MELGGGAMRRRLAQAGPHPQAASNPDCAIARIRARSLHAGCGGNNAAGTMHHRSAQCGAVPEGRIYQEHLNSCPLSS
jgi:hypothetical protein